MGGGGGQARVPKLSRPASSQVVPVLTPVDASRACWFLDPVIGWQQQVFYRGLLVLGKRPGGVSARVARVGGRGLAAGGRALSLLPRPDSALQCEDLCLLWVTLDILLDQLLVLQAMHSYHPVSG